MTAPKPPNLDPSPEQKEALDNLDNAIKAAWEAFGRSTPTEQELEDGAEDWIRTKAEDRMVSNWVVVLPVSGDGEDQVDMLWPYFPAMPSWQTKGLLTEALDQMR